MNDVFSDLVGGGGALVLLLVKGQEKGIELAPNCETVFTPINQQYLASFHK